MLPPLSSQTGRADDRAYISPATSSCIALNPPNAITSAARQTDEGADFAVRAVREVDCQEGHHQNHRDGAEQERRRGDEGELLSAVGEREQGRQEATTAVISR